MMQRASETMIPPLIDFVRIERIDEKDKGREAEDSPLPVTTPGLKSCVFFLIGISMCQVKDENNR